MFLSDPFICRHRPSETDCQNKLTLTSISRPKSPLHERDARFSITFFFSELVCKIHEDFVWVSASEVFASVTYIGNCNTP